MTAWTKIALALLVVAVLGIVAGTIWIAAGVREETVVAHPYEEGLRHHSERAPGAPCDLDDGPCTQPLEGGGEVTLEIGPRPLRTMQELTVRVRWREPRRLDPKLIVISQVSLVTTSVSFSMPGMEMGPNRVVLGLAAGTGPGADDALEGKAVLVRCPSGKREWIAEVAEVFVKGVGTPRVVRFAFQVED